MNREELKNKFWLNVEDTSFLIDEDCWNWKGTIDTFGYGRISFLGKNRKAHRVAYNLYRNPPLNLLSNISSHLHVCHKCDNRSCVNPSHLFLSSNAGNAKDRHSKGRTAKGEQIGRSFLTKEIVLSIRQIKKKIILTLLMPLLQRNLIYMNQQHI